MRSPSDLIVERAQAADASGVEAMLDAAATWQRSRGIIMWTPGQFGDEVRKTLATGELFVARRDRALVGCFLLDPHDPPVFTQWLKEQGRIAPPGAQLGRLAVAREAAGHGLGLELLDAASAITAEFDREYLRLDCPAENQTLKRFYLDAGFTHCGDVRTRGPEGERWVASLFERSTTQVDLVR